MTVHNLSENVVRLITRLAPSTIAGQPKRVWETFTIYDRLRGFGDYLRKCQARLQREVSSSRNELRQNGFSLVEPLSAEEAAAFSAMLEEHGDGFMKRRGNDYTAYLQCDERLYDPILEKVFQGTVDALITDFFGSEYVPYWAAYQVATPDVSAKRAFCWHCDKGPSKWLKILLYFTNSDDTGGNTILLNRQESEYIARTGYTFGPLKERVEDLAPIARRHGFEIHPLQFSIRAGQGVLFEPAQLMHRGLPPSKAPRKIMQILILPSPLPWRKALEKLRAADLPARRDLAFPTSARELEEAFGLA